MARVSKVFALSFVFAVFAVAHGIDCGSTCVCVDESCLIDWKDGDHIEIIPMNAVDDTTYEELAKEIGDRIACDAAYLSCAVIRSACEDTCDLEYDFSCDETPDDTFVNGNKVNSFDCTCTNTVIPDDYEYDSSDYSPPPPADYSSDSDYSPPPPTRSPKPPARSPPRPPSRAVSSASRARFLLW